MRTKRSISSKSRISLRSHELHVRLRHAVEAADIAAVGDADAQIVVDAAERIDEWRMEALLHREHALERQPARAA